MLAKITGYTVVPILLVLRIPSLHALFCSETSILFTAALAIHTL